MRIIMTITVVLLAAACAGRSPAPVALVQPQDRNIDCAAIFAEVAANNQTISKLGGEKGDKVAQNVVAITAGVIFLPFLFLMDFQGAAGKEIQALQARQQYLETLAEQQGCGVAQPVATPLPPTPPPAADTPSGPVAAPKSTIPSGAPTELDCVHPDGTKIRVNGTTCPSPSTPA